MLQRPPSLATLSRFVWWAGWLMLATGWVAVIVIDGFARVPLPSWMVSFPEHPPLALTFFFGEADDYRPALVESTQIVLLASSTVIALLLSHRAFKASRRDLAAAALVLSAGLALMYINDGHNVRHDITKVLSTAYYGTPDFPLRNPIRIGFELGFYAFIASFMLGAAYLTWRRRLPLFGSLPYLLVAYMAYAFASLASATRYFGSWYDRAGAAILSLFPEDFADRLQAIPSTSPNDPYPPEFWLMDWWVEESVELIGALCFFRALSIVFSGIGAAPETEPEDAGDP